VFLIGMIIGLVGLGSVVATVTWARAREVRLSWYTWTFFGLLVAYTLVIVAAIGAFIAEGEANAAGTFALIFLAIAVIGGVIFRVLLRRDARRSGTRSAAKA